MKIRLWHVIVFVLALVVFAVAWAPAAVFVPQRPGQLSYDRAEGTIWRARLSGVRLGSYAAATATWRLALLDIVQGKAIVPVQFSDGDIEGTLTLLGNWHGDRRLAVQNLRLDGLALAQRGRLAGETRINGLDILFEDGVCTRALGRIESDVLQRGGQALGWPGPALAGDASCDGADARILLTGANEQGERVDVRIMLKGDGAATWRAAVLTQQPATVEALLAAGFNRSAADGSLGYGEDTRWFP